MSDPERPVSASVYDQIRTLLEQGEGLPPNWGAPSPATLKIAEEVGTGAGDRPRAMEGGRPNDPKL